MKLAIRTSVSLIVVLLLFTGCGTGDTTTPVPATATTSPPTQPPPTVEPEAELAPDLFSLGDITVRNTDGMVMVYVPSGEFEMGWPGGGDTSRTPIHTVALDGFWIDQTEVTNAQYELCVAAGQCEPSRYADIEWLNGDNQPVVAITWYDADAYCTWAGGQLLTEAQLEYAARGPEGRKFPWGEELPDCTMANFMDCIGTTADVGSYPAGASWCGALDLAGNVYEWAANWHYQYTSEKEYNPTGPEETDDPQERKKMRGGSWTDRPENLLSAQRMRFEADLTSDTVGLRCLVPQTEVAASDVTSGSWWQTYGNNGNQTNSGILEADDGGYYIIGATDVQFEPERSGNIYLIRTDADGQLLWEKSYGQGTKGGQALIQTRDGNLLILAVTASPDAQGIDAYLLKVDPEGNEIWSQSFGGPLDDILSTIDQTADGGYILSGNIVDTNDFVTDPGVAGYAGYAHRSSMLLVKIDAEGNELWSRSYDNGLNVVASGGVQTQDGGFAMVGTIINYPDSDNDIYLLRVDENGEVLWSFTWEEGRASGYDLVQTADGGYVITGPYFSLDDEELSSADSLFLKVDDQGNELWANVYGDPDILDYTSLIAETADGGYIAAGDRTESLYRSDSDIVLIKIDGDGQFLWRQTIEAGTHIMYTAILQHVDGGYVINGTILQRDQFDILLLKTDVAGNVIE